MAKQIRMLIDQEIDGTIYRCGSVVQIDDDVAESLVKAGVADKSRAAVAYALSESGGVFQTHESTAAPVAATAAATDTPAA